jgi:hypothetical protein
MARACKWIGTLLVAAGVALAVTFGLQIAHDRDYARKELIASRNPGNDVYKLEFGLAQIKRGFQIVFLSGGVLLGLNGLTLIAIGAVAGRVRKSGERE